MTKILITGGYGMLATDLNNILSQNEKYEILSVDIDKLDITSKQSVESVFSQFNPDYVIHTAAITNVDYCEDHIEDAYKVNGYGTENVAYYSNKAKAKLIYISSCGMFGDEVKEYTETDPIVLKTEYAKSKYMGEEKVLEHCNKYFIVRPGWLFGGSKEHKKNFVYNRYLEAQQKPEIQSAGDKYGCPTYTLHLSQALLRLLATDAYGLYHVSNSGYGSRYDYVKHIIDVFGLSTQVVKVDSNAFPRKAPVPDCEVIKNVNLVKSGFELLPHWKDAIEEYISKLRKEM